MRYVLHNLFIGSFAKQLETAVNSPNHIIDIEA